MHRPANDRGPVLFRPINSTAAYKISSVLWLFPARSLGYPSRMLADADLYVAPAPILDGMSLLIGAFFFYCLANPSRVKNRTQFWAVFAVLVLIVLFYTLRLMLYNSAAGQVFTGVFIGMLQVAGLVLTVMYAGGLSLRDLGDELSDAADEFRRGEPAKPVIVPLTGAVPKPKANPMRDEPRINLVQPPPPRVSIELPKDPAEPRIPLD